MQTWYCIYIMLIVYFQSVYSFIHIRGLIMGVFGLEIDKPVYKS